MSNFSTRLKTLLSERKPTPWGVSLGLHSATPGRMLNNKPPSYEAILAIAHAENANISWLLTGNGMPFNVEHFCTDVDIAKALDGYIKDKEWNIYLLFDQKNTVIVLSDENAIYTFKDKEIPYRDIKVLIAPVGKATLNGLTATLMLKKSCPIHGVYIKPEEYKLLAEGQLGTYLLFGTEKQPGVIKLPQKIADAAALQEFVLTTSDKCAEINNEIMSRIVTLVEKVAQEENLLVTPELKSRIISLAYRRAVYSGITSDMLDKFMIQSLFDMSSE